jgi:hypothetical protein
VGAQAGIGCQWRHHTFGYRLVKLKVDSVAGSAVETPPWCLHDDAYSCYQRRCSGLMGPVFREKRGVRLLSPPFRRHSTIPLRFDDGQEGAVEVRAELLGNVAQHLVEVFRDAERPTDALARADD